MCLYLTYILRRKNCYREQGETMNNIFSNFVRYIFQLLCLSLVIDMGMFNFWCEWTVLGRGSCYSVNITCFRDVRKETLAREAIYSCVAGSDSQTSLSLPHIRHIGLSHSLTHASTMNIIISSRVEWGMKWTLHPLSKLV